MKKSKLVLVYSFRYDANLVPDLIRNTKKFVDDYVFWDDRKDKDKWYHEGETRKKLIEEAIKKGADWILAMDPDERLEINAGRMIRDIIDKGSNEKKVYGFKFRELWKPTSFRSDGIWGQKVRYNLFPVHPNQKFMNLKVHSPWHPINDDYEFVMTDINLYHLKMIDPQNREDRKNLYKEIDKNNEIQAIGYDYLTIEEGIELKKITFARRYYPRYKKSYRIKQTL